MPETERIKGTGQRVVSNGEIASFCEQISMLLRAGIQLYQCLDVFVEDMAASKSKFKEQFKKVNEKVKETGLLSKGLEEAGVFPDYMIKMTKIGEKTGRTDEILEALAVHYDRLETFQNQINSAILYPMILIGMMAVVIFVLINNVLPVFAQVYGQLGSGGSASAANAMQFGTLSASYMLIVLGVLFVIILVGLILSKSRKGEAALSGFMSKFVLTKNLSAKIATGKFASAMAIQLVSGITPESAVDLAAETVDNPYVLAKIKISKELASADMSWGNAIDKSGIFTGTNNRLVKIGLKSGYLDKTMQKIAQVYDEEVAMVLNRASGVIEPVLVAVLSVVIGVVLISVMLPLINIMSLIG